jgi:PAS domain-containing protein
MTRTPSIRPLTYAALISIALAGAGIVWLLESVIAEGRTLSTAEDIFLDLLIGIVVLFALGWLLLWSQSRDRERYHREIEEEKNKLDTAVRHMSQGLVMFDAVHRVVLWNPRYLELHGVSPAIMKPDFRFGIC